jgi:hypothetical protein
MKLVDGKRMKTTTKNGPTQNQMTRTKRNEGGNKDGDNRKKKAKPVSYAFRKLRHYQNDMKQFQALPVVYFKMTIKKTKRGNIIEKDLAQFYALPLEDTEKKIQDLSLHC